MHILRKGGIVLQCQLHRDISLVRVDIDHLLGQPLPVDVEILHKLNQPSLREKLLSKWISFTAITVLRGLTPVSKGKKDILVKESQFPQSGCQDIKFEVNSLKNCIVRHERGYST